MAAVDAKAVAQVRDAAAVSRGFVVCSCLTPAWFVALQKLEFKVGMTCGGCKTAVTKILQKTPGVSAIDADVDKKQVIVRAPHSTSINVACSS